MRLMTVLLQLDVINLKTFAIISVDLAEITQLDKQDYLQMVLELFDATETPID